MRFSAPLNATQVDLVALEAQLNDLGIPRTGVGLGLEGKMVHIDHLDEESFTASHAQAIIAAVASYVYTPDPAPLRAERTRRLAACDWTQLADAPLSPDRLAAWATYRQALRDVPGQPGFPVSIEWPPPPA